MLASLYFMAKILGQLEKHSAKTRNSCGSSKPSTLVRLVWAWYVGVHSPKYSYKNHQGIGDQLIAMDSQKRNMHPNSMRCFLTQKQKWLCDQQLLRWSRNIYGLQRERCLPASTLTLTAPLTDTTTWQTISSPWAKPQVQIWKETPGMKHFIAMHWMNVTC